MFDEDSIANADAIKRAGLGARWRLRGLIAHRRGRAQSDNNSVDLGIQCDGGVCIKPLI
jgi:hypothetical protein